MYVATITSERVATNSLAATTSVHCFYMVLFAEMR